MSDLRTPDELRDQSTEELRELEREEQENLFGLRLQLRTERLRDFGAVTRSKRQLARIKTIIREKELEIR